MDIVLKTEYWNDLNARAAFKSFMRTIHGLDFSLWESAGCWDDAYTPFSFFQGDKIVASVCIYLLDSVIDGRETRLAQVSGVGTLPQWRRRGLSRQLTEIGLAWAQDRHDGIFLFADTDAIPYYERTGFSPIEEYVVTARLAPTTRRTGAVKLDPGRAEDLEKIRAYTTRRAPISNTFSVLNEKLVMFHVLYTLRNCVYEVPDLDCLVFFERKNGCVRLFDIVGERTPPLAELYPYIANAHDSIAELHFQTDQLGLDETETRVLPGNNPFVRGAFPVDKPVFPFTSRA